MERLPFAYVADTYNHAIRRLDLRTGETTTIVGGEAGWADGVGGRLREPVAIAVTGDALWVADRGNHSVRAVDLSNGAISTLIIRPIVGQFAMAEDDPTVDLGEFSLALGGGSLAVQLDIARGYTLNTAAPLSYRVYTPSRTVAGSIESSDVVLDIPMEWEAGDYRVELFAVYCRTETPDLCLLSAGAYRFTVTLNTLISQSTVSSPDLVLTHRVSSDM